MKYQMLLLLQVALLLMCGVIDGAEEKAAPENAKEAAAAGQEPPAEITDSIGMKLKLIPAGEFMMGSAKSPQEIVQMFKLSERHVKSLKDEHPQHTVRITKPFYLGVYEVTQTEYEKVMGKNPSCFSKGGRAADRVSGKDTSRHPVEYVSWEDAVEFCKKLSAKEGKTYRLPTEAEWEYACRAGTTTLYGFGDDPASLGEYAWYRENSGKKTHPVGKKKPNDWGLYDMHGNVWEWCQDRYGEDYYAESSAESSTDDPPGPEKGSSRVPRGGSWINVARLCHSAYRYGSPQDNRGSGKGFRVAVGPVDASGR